MSDYHDALRQIGQEADQKIVPESRLDARGIGGIIVQDRLLRWAIALLVMMALLSVVP